MIKIVEGKPQEEQRKVVAMNDMQPLQVGKVISGPSIYIGRFVMRTAAEEQFEVMDLTKPSAEGSWIRRPSDRIIDVELLLPSESITLKIFNE